jgi:stearoyl-CoA desaturase (delta-9 desaturase)
MFKVPENEVKKAKANIELYKAQKVREQCDWGTDPKSLPTITYNEFQSKVKDEGREWMLIDEFVLDVKEFKTAHPGGEKILKAYYGKDSTKAFYGGLNNHTKSARLMLAMLRIAKIDRLEKISH